MSETEYKITVKTGTIMIEGWTEGYGTINGFRIPAPKWVVKDEKTMSWEEFAKEPRTVT